MAATQRPRLTSIPPPLSFSNEAVQSPLLASPVALRGLKSPVNLNSTSTQRWPNVEVDYSRTHPDDLFTRLSVSEVKAIHAKLRHDADSKQDELRTMVGERYRDLLQASTSIISIASVSKTVTSTLEELEQASTAESGSSVQPIPRKSTAATEASDLPTLQSLSAHMKLLLDAPEQLWRLLEAHNYLHAAWLFLLSRVVYRSLTRDESQDDDDIEISWAKSGIDVSEQFPLTQRQWETISQFRSQISHKATQSLRMTERTARETCDTLVAILLLDSIAVSDTVSLFLTQRSKALRTLLTKLSPTSASPSRLRPPSPLSTDRHQNREAASALLKVRPSSPSRGGRRRGASPSWRSRRSRKEAVAMTRDTLKQALDLLVGTVETIRAIYGGGSTNSNSEPPLVEQILELVQSSSAGTTPKKRSRHASRLSIISSFHATPTPLPSRNPSQPLTSTTILDSLPSSQLLLQFLPPSIVSYSPYIDTASARAQLSPSLIATASTAWFDASLASLRSHISSWFERLDTIRAVWESRSLLVEYQDRLTASEMARLTRVIDDAAAERVQAIWTTYLTDIKQSATDSVAAALKSLQVGADEASVSPLTFRTSPAPLPSFNQSTPQDHSFGAFKSALQWRIVGHDPLLVETQTALEKAAHKIKKDLRCMQSDDSRNLSEELLRRYHPKAHEAGLEIVEHIKISFDEAASDHAAIFLGRLCVGLATSSRFVDELVAGDTQNDLRQSFLRVFEESISRWRTSTVTASIAEYARASVAYPAEGNNVKLSASSGLAQALLFLVGAIQRLGLSSEELNAHHIPETLLESFNEGLRTAERGKLSESQAAWDRAFVQRLVATFHSLTQTNGHSSETDRVAAVEAQLIRWQVMLGPLVGPKAFERSKATSGGKSGGTTSLLLPLGAPPGQEEFAPALQFVKPGPRFAMLLVGKGGERSATGSSAAERRRPT
ncbi:hypothetical protein DL93DRAFT_2223145 [Clavulina sp. PMI_390]|nr:hypothetical protein DL93DRAFT_2223145 [Clavulina sp. PMI_390]